MISWTEPVLSPLVASRYWAKRNLKFAAESTLMVDGVIPKMRTGLGKKPFIARGRGIDEQSAVADIETNKAMTLHRYKIRADDLD